MPQEQAMDRAFRGNERVQEDMKRSALDMTQTRNKDLERILERARAQSRTRTQDRGRDR